MFYPNRQGGVYCVGACKTKAEAEEAHEKAAKRDQWQRDNFAEEVDKYFGRETRSGAAKPRPTEKKPSVFDELRFGWFGWFLIVVIAGKLLKLVLVE